MVRGSCDTCEEQEGVYAEGTELWCGTCYSKKKLKEKGDKNASKYTR